MPLEWSTTSKEIENSGVKALIYGPSGVGKTMLCATAPRPIVISCESGLLSLSRANLEKVFGVGRADICYDLNVAKIKDIQDLTAALEWCNNKANHQYFDTVLIDSGSEIGEVVLNNAKKQVKDARQAYGELIEKMEMCVRGFRDIPNKHVVMLAKQEPTKDELSGIVTQAPMMPGAKLSVKLPYLFDEVFRLGVNKTPQGETYRFLQTSPDLQHTAKDRSGMLNAVEVPHLGYIFSKILGVQ